MKRPVLDRYEISDGGEVVIDVSVENVEDLYNEFDRTSPYLKKDLDEDFVDYLIDCGREIGKRPFIVRISFSKSRGESSLDRVRKSMMNYFSYLRVLESRAMGRVFRRSAIMFGIGLVLLALAIFAARHLTGNPSVMAEVFAQGLTVAAWVSLWEAIANLLLEWQPHHRDRRLYTRLGEAVVIFRYPGGEDMATR